MQTCQHDLLYNTRLGVRYHMRRQAFFERWHRLTGIISLVGGSTAVATITHQVETVGIVAAAIIAVTQAIDLMVDTRKYGELHKDLRRRYTLLEPKLTAGDLTPEQCNQVEQEIKNIEAEEPPVRLTLVTICQNDTLTAMGHDDKDQPKAYTKKINIFRRVFAQIW